LPWFESPHTRDLGALVKSFGLGYLEANDAGSLHAALTELYKPSERAVVLHVRTDAQLSPKVLRDYFKSLRP